MTKRDHYGIYLKIENICLETIELCITASFESGSQKNAPLKTLRIKLEILKRLIRLSNNLHIVESKTYLDMETDLQNLSKMTNGWIKYLNNSK